MSNPETLSTKRLLLKPLTDSDAGKIAELANNRNVAKNLASMPHPYYIKDARDWIKRQNNERGLDHFHFGLFGLNDQGEKQSVKGVISVFNLRIAQPEYGFWLGEPFWGQGLMTEAAIALRDFVFASLNAPCLLSKHLLENPASGRVVETCGLSETERSPLWSRIHGKFCPGRTLKLERIDWERLKGL